MGQREDEAPRTKSVSASQARQPARQAAALPAHQAGLPEASRPDEVDAAASLALVDEALKKTWLVWVTLPSGRTQPCWHSWVGGHVYLLTGPGEQPDPGLAEGDTVKLVVRSKDNSQRLLGLAATTQRLQPGDPDWDTATSALAAGRLNLSKAAQAPQRWATDPATVIYRLVPTGELLEGPGAYPDTSHRAVPVSTPATTAAALPRVLHRRGGSGRPLS